MQDSNVSDNLVLRSTIDDFFFPFYCHLVALAICRRVDELELVGMRATMPGCVPPPYHETSPTPKQRRPATKRSMVVVVVDKDRDRHDDLILSPLHPSNDSYV
jgi:hypothetical protein